MSRFCGKSLYILNFYGGQSNINLGHILWSLSMEYKDMTKDHMPQIDNFFKIW